MFSIGLSAFLEAMVHFDAKKGNFYGFAKLVIDRRIINYLKKTKRHHHENIDDYLIPDPQEPLDEQVMLKDELQSFERVLNNFNITFEDFIEDTPKHIDTRNRAKQIGKQVSEDKTITEKLYQKYKLPVTAICNKFMVTRKVIYGCKKYITSIAIVYIEKFDLLKKWI